MKKYAIFPALFCLFTIHLFGQTSGVVINEVLAENHDNFFDPDNNQSVDWIELKNTTLNTIDISGYFLTDNKNEFFMWEIPSNHKLAPGATLLVWADGLDLVDKALHTNFKVNNGGEWLGLISPDGALLDSLLLEKQYGDISYGREPNSIVNTGYFATPTPGSENSAVAIKSMDRSDPPIFSHNGGFFRSGFPLSLDALSGEIRFTVDGSLPTKQSMLYTESIQIQESAVVRARVFENDKIPSKVVTHSFIIDYNGTLPIFSVATNPQNISDQYIGVYVDEDIQSRKGWERYAHIELFESNGMKGFSDNSYFRLFGRTAIFLPQKSLAFFSSNKIKYPVFQEESVPYYKSLILRSSSDDWDDTMFRDGIVQSFIRDHFDIDTQAFRPAVMLVNGQYFGINNIREKYNEAYLEAHYGVDRDNIDLLYVDLRADDVEVIAGDDVQYQHMINYLEDNDLSVPENYAHIEAMLDIDNYIEFVILQSILGNVSWAHNIRVWRERSNGIKWRWLVFDLDRVMTDVNANIFSDMKSRDPIFKALLDNTDFQNKLANRFYYHMNFSFQQEILSAYIDSATILIEEEMPQHIERWGDVCGNGVCGISSMNEWYSEIDELYTFIKERPAIAITQLDQLFELPEKTTLNVDILPSGGGEIILNDTLAFRHDFSMLFSSDEKVNLHASAHQGFEFERWQTSRSLTKLLIPKGSEWKYWDRVDAPDPAWREIDFNDSAWLSGKAQFGYGDGDEATLLDYGDADDKTISYYFRYNLDLSDPSMFAGYDLHLLRDDGAVIYVNGEEVVREKMPSGDIDHNTRATEATGSENTFHQFQLESKYFRSGLNVIAVEIHQASSTSSDVSFDLELSGQNTPSNIDICIEAGSEWIFWDQELPPSGDWTQLHFDDSAWRVGNAQLGYGDGDEQTELNFGSDANNKIISYYFRKKFEVSSLDDVGSVELELMRDDGAIVYLNGREVARSNMPTGSIAHDTHALEIVGGSEEEQFFLFELHPTSVVVGENIIAVRVHQANGNSSDLGFDLALHLNHISDPNTTILSTDPAFDVSLVSDSSITAVFKMDQSKSLPAVVNSNLTLSSENSPYFAVQDIVVQENVTLQINAGVEIQFAEGTGVLVHGNLIANGTQEQPIELNCFSGSYWNGITFQDATTPSVLSFVTIRNAQSRGLASWQSAALSSEDSDLTLDHVIFRKVFDPVSIKGGKIHMMSCVLDGTRARDDILHVQYSDAIIEDCELFGDGELDFDYVDNSIIRNNSIRIISNDSNQDALDLGSSKNVLIEGNVLFDCPDKGISIGEESDARVIRNIIFNCHSGIAVKDNSTAIIVNNTLYRNTIGVNCYEKNAGQGGGTAEINNTIFADCLESDVSLDDLSSTTISYSLSNSNALPGQGNVYASPDFLDAEHHIFSLLASSAAIDAGDPNEPFDPDGTQSDIGALYYDQRTKSFTLQINEICPDNQSLIVDDAGEYDDWIEIYNSGSEFIDLSGLFLTDDLTNPAKWRIPATQTDETHVHAQGFKLIWLDNDTEQGLLHAPFRLDANGEQVGLFFIEGLDTVLIDSVSFGSVASDVSLGRQSDGDPNWLVYNHPTPGYSNSDINTRLKDTPTRPETFSLFQNYPNPFNPKTVIRIALPKSENTSLIIFDLLGRQIKKLVNKNLDEGWHEFEWDGTNAAGAHVSTGVYFYQFCAGDFTDVKKMLYLR